MRFLRSAWSLVSSRALAPVVFGFFLLFYIVVAFGTEDVLTALMEFTRRSFLLTLILALLPLNFLCRLIREFLELQARRRALTGGAVAEPERLFEEAVTLEAAPVFSEPLKRLEGEGYRVRHSAGSFAAWRGVNGFPARALYLVAVFSLFAGILISLITRNSLRGAVIEGEPMATASGNGGVVSRITLTPQPDAIVAKKLEMEVAPEGGEGRAVFGLYPPALYRGAFIYPRYLGVGILMKFSAPDLPQPHQSHQILPIYPPGKEAPVELKETPYRMMFSLEEPGDGSDPYVTGKMTFLFKLMKGKDVVFSGKAPAGGEFVKDGYRLEFPDVRKLVITDSIQDFGVYLIWGSALLFLLAFFVWLPVRFFFPRREMVFKGEGSAVLGCSHAEGKVRSHGGVFHEVLDLLESGRGERSSSPEDGPTA